MRYGPAREASAQLSLLGDLDRTEHTPQSEPAGFKRWTTRAQVNMLLAHPRIQELWPTGNYVAADPCAGTGQLMRHVDDALQNGRPLLWRAWEIDAGLVARADRYQSRCHRPPWWRRRVRWNHADAARLGEQDADMVVTNLPWFGVFARLVGHWRDVAFPRATIIALCDDQERTRESARRWLEAGNMPALIAQLPGRQSFDGADDGAYPWSCSWYVWRPGERRTTSDVIML